MHETDQELTLKGVKYYKAAFICWEWNAQKKKKII